MKRRKEKLKNVSSVYFKHDSRGHPEFGILPHLSMIWANIALYLLKWPFLITSLNTTVRLMDQSGFLLQAIRKIKKKKLS